MVTATTTEQHTDSELQQSFHFGLNFKLLVQFSLEWFLYETSCWELALNIWQFICIILRDHKEIFSNEIISMTTLLFNFTVKVASQPKFTSPRWAALGSETLCFHHSFIFCFTLAAGRLSLSLSLYMHTVVHNTLEMCEEELKPWSLALILIWIAPHIILRKFSLTCVVKNACLFSYEI